MAKTKKIDPKATFKSTIMAQVSEALKASGIEVADGADYGFTSGTIVVKGESFDIQIKPIAPKAGLERYELAE